MEWIWRLANFQRIWLAFRTRICQVCDFYYSFNIPYGSMLWSSLVKNSHWMFEFQNFYFFFFQILTSKTLQLRLMSCAMCMVFSKLCFWTQIKTSDRNWKSRVWVWVYVRLYVWVWCKRTITNSNLQLTSIRKGKNFLSSHSINSIWFVQNHKVPNKQQTNKVTPNWIQNPHLLHCHSCDVDS